MHVLVLNLDTPNSSCELSKIATKISRYCEFPPLIVHRFFSKIAHFDPIAIADLSIPFERSMKELPNACFSFEVGRS